MSMLKTARPFKLGTTSFIYPDHIVPNVKKLGPQFDEIELLIFESKPLEYLPKKADIDELARLSQELSVTYNIHLPTDISLSHGSNTERQEGIDTVERIMELVTSLSPSTHTLHLDFTVQDREAGEEGIKRWQERVMKSLDDLAARIPDPSLITIETLDFSPGILFPVLDNSPVSLCIDAGHLIRFDYDIAEIFERYQSKIPLIHFHGVDFAYDPPKDHQGLDKTPMERVVSTLEVLKQFTGVVSLEVFNLDNLTASVAWMENHFFAETNR